MRPTTSTTSFLNVVSELATNFAKLWKEASDEVTGGSKDE